MDILLVKETGDAAFINGASPVSSGASNTGVPN